MRISLVALVVLFALAAAAQILVRWPERPGDDIDRAVRSPDTVINEPTADRPVGGEPEARSDAPVRRRTRFENDVPDDGRRRHCERLVDEAIRSDDPLRRQAILAELAAIGGPDAVRALDRLAQSAPEEMLQHVATRLGRIESRTAAPLLRSIIEREGRAGPLAVSAMRALGLSRRREDVPLARETATDESLEADMRAAAVDALGWIADPVSLPALARLARSDEPLLRRRAIRAVSRMPSKASEDLLESLIEDPPGELERSLAETALATLRGEPRLRR